ncbi:MAG: membrane protein insertase YidC [Candidatus Dasytiphilus stammeri]
MDLQRNLILIAFIFVSFMIWQSWQNDHKTLQSKLKNTPENIWFKNTQHFPFIKNKGKIISVKTDVLSLRINTYGGDIIQAQLLSYPESLNSHHPIKLLQTTPTIISQAQSGLSFVNNSSTRSIKEKTPIYQVKHDSYLMNKLQQDTLKIPFYWKDNNGIFYTKIFSFKKHQYSINIKYYITNNSLYPIKVSMYGQLKQSTIIPKKDLTIPSLSYNNSFSVAYSTKYKKYKKYKLRQLYDNNLMISTLNGWIAILQPYFITAWIPHSQGTNIFYTKNDTSKMISVGYKSNAITIYPGESKELSSTLWMGPKLQDQMAVAAPYLDLTVDYGWLWFISKPLFKLLKAIQMKIGNWGFSIILITLIVRTLMYPLTKTQFISIAKMRSLQPKIQEIRDRLGNNKQKMSQEIMDLYKSEKINPLGGCFPLIIQMPIFLALYYMLINAVELRHAPFILWIKDLSAKDPYYVLPILMGITMLIIQKMSPSTITDPMQKRIMEYMPIIFTLFFLWFPSGLVLYYIVSNVVTIIQQKLIDYNLKKQTLYKSNN